MSYVTPFDSLDTVTAQLTLPALDIASNFFPVDAVTSPNGKNNTKRNENNFIIKKNGAQSVIISYKTFDVDKVSTSKDLKQVYPSVAKKGTGFQFKTEYYVRNTEGEVISDEPVVALTQVYKSNGCPVNTGTLVLQAICNHLASALTLGDDEAGVDTTQLDRLVNGGTAPIGIR